MIIETSTEAANPSTWARPSRVWTTRPAYARRKEFADLVAQLPFEATPAQAALAWVAQQDRRHDGDSRCEDRRAGESQRGGR